MFKYHRFELKDKESTRWSDVHAGDLVSAPGTIAYRANEFANRDRDTNVVILANKLLLVLSRFDAAVPGEPDTEGCTTFVVLSRHGPLVVMMNK